MKSEEKRLTKWEAGQEIVKVADALSEAASELKDWPELQNKIKSIRKDISRLFKDNKLDDEMGFGL